MELIECINGNQPLESIENYLRTLDEKNLDIQLTTKDSNDHDPLKMAILKNDKELVKLLLFFGISTSGAENFALMQKNPEIAALIRTWGLWQEQARSIANIRFDKTIRLIETSNALPDGGKGKDAVMIFGKTGHGKTTLVNYLFDIDFQIISEDSQLSVIPKNKDAKLIAPIGNGYISKTDIPYICA